jgi:hypothetical protein
MRMVLKGVMFIALISSLGSCATLSPNNEAAEAACIGRGGIWNREDQFCLNLGKLFENNDAAEAACIGRGGVWFSNTQSCIDLNLDS